MLPEQQQRILGYFIEEAKDHLNTIEQGLLSLQNTIRDPEMLNEVFRAAHSVKGGAAMLGINGIQRTAHRLEDCFKVLKECPIQVDRELESLFLRVFDTLQGLLEHLQGPFGLREDVTHNLMSEVEPVFEALNQHLGLLVSRAGGNVQAEELVPTLAPVPVVEPKPQRTPIETTFLPVFQSQVLQQLRRMLHLFKQAESPQGRAALQECCSQLFQLGKKFNLSGWSQLCQKAASAIANPANSYRALAPIVIKEIKQSQELVLAGRETDIAIGQQLETLLLAGNGARELGRKNSPNPQRETQIFPIPRGKPESLQSPISSLSPASPVSSPQRWGEVPASEWSIDRTGPLVGTAELNSLADLFETEAPDLDENWQQEEVLESGSTDLGKDSIGFEDAGESDDLSDFLFEDTAPSASPTSATTAEDLTLLFGDFLEEEYLELNSDREMTAPSAMKPINAEQATGAVMPLAAVGVAASEANNLSDLFALEDEVPQPDSQLISATTANLTQQRQLPASHLGAEKPAAKPQVRTTPHESSSSQLQTPNAGQPTELHASPTLLPSVEGTSPRERLLNQGNPRTRLAPPSQTPNFRELDLDDLFDEVETPPLPSPEATDFSDLFDLAEEGETHGVSPAAISPRASSQFEEDELTNFWEDAGDRQPEVERVEQALDAALEEDWLTASGGTDRPQVKSVPPMPPPHLVPADDLFNLDEARTENLFEDTDEAVETPLEAAFDELFAGDARRHPDDRHHEIAALFDPETAVPEMVDTETMAPTEAEPLDFEALDLSALDSDERASLVPKDRAQLDSLIDLEEDRFDFEPDTPSSAVDEFAELEAILAEDVPAATSAFVRDEFAELEKLLEADKTSLSSRRDRDQTAGSRRRRTTFEQTMRVPVKYLDNLSNLVGELVVNRNSLEQDQERLRQFLDNLLHQVHQLSDAGSRMQELYERSLLEASLLASRKGSQSSFRDPADDPISSVSSNLGALELDRFTPFHTLSQEIIELIVRVRESAADIGFVTDETEQVARQFRQVTSQLQEGLMQTRMVPFAHIADRLPRAVRDIAIRCGKQAELKVIDEGRDTLIDKVILEQLYDPMTHLVNNAITHGIELPEERAAKGKPPVGSIVIRAFHQGNQTVISVSDDGAGIDPEKVKAKAVQKGTISLAEAKAMSRMDVYDLLFRPGFTTKDRVDDFCGRGIGMDVVRTSLSEMRGAIATDSTPGRGTTFTIRLPLTLSICKALCCLSDRARIAFPMDGVEDAIDVPSNHVRVNEEGHPCIAWRDSLVPFKPLKELLVYNRQLSRGSVYGGNREDDTISIVVLRSAGHFIALQVDRVLGEQEIVIKQFEDPAPKPVGVAGATVLGDGRIMPIADVIELIDLFHGGLGSDVSGYMWGDRSDAPVQLEPPVAVKHDPTVLIVDDSITVRELLSLTFSKAGYRVEQARDGQEAWDKLRSGLPCDIVFCDIEMPRCDGLELLSRIQKDPGLQHLPIAMLTSRGADRHRQMAIQLGASGYFTKPYLEEALLDAAARMLRGEVLVTANATS